MGRTFVIGDIHGEYNKLVTCLSKIDLNREDRLIFLGDYCDRGPSTYLVVDLLLELNTKYECIFIKGNHDHCFFDGLRTGEYMLMNQGCKETIDSYIKHCAPDKVIFEFHRTIRNGSIYKTDFEFTDMPHEHYGFWANLLPYYIDEDNNLFVHGGFNRHYTITDLHNSEDVLIWDRDLIHQARSYDSMNDKSFPFKMKDNFKHVYIGHTPTMYLEATTKPLTYANVTLLDTGCGKGDFPLTIMNLQIGEIFQS